uniref:Uncharacterized protein n=1 Tax=Anguilla anguilla TaxID=7936 RepID=A0A0E9UZN6_ANGAN
MLQYLYLFYNSAKYIIKMFLELCSPAL